MSGTETASAAKKPINVAIIEDRREIRECLAMLIKAPKASSAKANPAQWRKAWVSQPFEL